MERKRFSAAEVVAIPFAETARKMAIEIQPRIVPFDVIMTVWLQSVCDGTYQPSQSVLRTHIMRKSFLIGTSFLTGILAPLFHGEIRISAQEPGAVAADTIAAEIAYPLGVSVDGEIQYVVDLDLPGVWEVKESTRLFVRGSNLLRQPMNRPRCVVSHPDGGILVGDSASRDVYHVGSKGAVPIGLTSGHIGIPMALAISPDQEFVYVGDAEKRVTFRVPVDGGHPELVARVNARGLAFKDDSNLLAVTPDANAVVSIDIGSGEITNVITDRPYQYPNGLVWAGDHGFVTDGYGKQVWKFTLDGKTEVWHDGAPLVGPVGIAIDETAIYVADPKQKQLFRFDRESKEATELMKSR